MTTDYNKFLEAKSRKILPTGINIPASDLHPALKDFQKFSTSIALKNGRFALFEDCGLGKTFQQLVWADHVQKHTGRPVLALAPLAVTGQTIKEGEKFGIAVNEYGAGNIQITNYEQLENIDIDRFSAVILDESSILKNHTGAYRNLLINKFRQYPFKLACTATPSPNDPMELGNHAEFLNVMSYNEMLATYFIHDGGETAKWRLKGHAENSFWEWMCSWVLMFSKPSDIGFSDEGYILPELKFIENQIITNIKEGKLFNDIAVSATNFHQEVRLTKVARLEQVADIVNGSNESFIVWIEQDAEGDYLRKILPDAIEVKGSDKDHIKKERLLGFADSKFSRLITKPKIAAFGLNYQNCHNQIFASPDHSFEKIYQAVRRSYRFGQKERVNIYLVTTDTMENVMESFKRKQAQHNTMQSMMNYYTKKIYGNKNYKTAA